MFSFISCFKDTKKQRYRTSPLVRFDKSSLSVGYIIRLTIFSKITWHYNLTIGSNLFSIGKQIGEQTDHQRNKSVLLHTFQKQLSVKQRCT